MSTEKTHTKENPCDLTSKHPNRIISKILKLLHRVSQCLLRFTIFRIISKTLKLLYKLSSYLLRQIENLINIIDNKTAYDKVIINFFLTFIIPVLFLNMPISGNLNEFTENWGNSIADQLQQGLLFSTTMSIAATYISTYISRVNELARKGENGKHTGDPHQSNLEAKKNFNFIANYSNTLFWALSALLLSAILLGVSRTSNSQLNIIIILLQLALYFGILIIYGYSEKIVREKDWITSDQINCKTRSDQKRAKMEKNVVENNFSREFLNEFIKERD